MIHITESHKSDKMISNHHLLEVNIYITGVDLNKINLKMKTFIKI